MRLSGSEGSSNRLGTGSSEDDDVEERVGSESVRSVNGNASGFSSGVQSGDDDVFTVL